MEKIKKIFHILSYIQYPFSLLGTFFIIKPLWSGFENISSNPEYFFSIYNNALIFLGLAISFSTLQDPDRIPLKFEKKIYKNPKKGKLYIALTMVLVFVFFIYGIIGYFGLLEKSNIITEFSYGSIILGISLIGYLKLQIEIFDKHREDRKK